MPSIYAHYTQDGRLVKESESLLLDGLHAEEDSLEARLQHIEHYDRAHQPRKPYRAHATVGRNEPCPCGSGRKFKKCCGK